MGYKVDWIGTVALGVVTDGGRPLAFSLEEGQTIPQSFKEGDRLYIQNNPDPLAEVIPDFQNNGFYEIEHAETGDKLRTYHRADMYKVDRNR
jgi:hypothetical protein